MSWPWPGSGSRLAEALRVDPTRVPTRPSRAAKVRRLEAKRRQSERKAARRRPATTNGDSGG